MDCGKFGMALKQPANRTYWDAWGRKSLEMADWRPVS